MYLTTPLSNSTVTGVFAMPLERQITPLVSKHTRR